MPSHKAQVVHRKGRGQGHVRLSSCSQDPGGELLPGHSLLVECRCSLLWFVTLPLAVLLWLRHSQIWKSGLRVTLELGWE